MWLAIYGNPQGRIPVFIELKKLNDISDLHLESYLRFTISDGSSNFSDDEFRALCDDGRFVFLFDAFDEIKDDVRIDAERELLDLANNYPRCGFVISSRKDSRFSAWEQFSTYHAAAFDQKQIKMVIQSVDFDKDVRRRFIAEIIDKKEKFEEFSDFLSTPLLALMMLLMYRQFADVPEKIHLFYRYAFQTLYSLHDGNKESFTRQRKTSLDEDQFCKIFSIFSLMTYGQMSTSFGAGEVRSLVSAAVTRSGIAVDIENFLDEAVESVNLLYKEGEIYSFVHRSFQEYFAAYAVVNFFSAKMSDVLLKMPDRADDKFYTMTYEMNADIVDDYFLCPQYRENKSFFDGIVSKEFDTKGILQRVRAKWFFLVAGNVGQSVMLQDSLYIASGPMKFCRIAGRCLSLDFSADFEFTTGKSVSRENEIQSMHKFLLKIIKRRNKNNERAVLVIIDFGNQTISVDDDDGVRANLDDTDFAATERQAYLCKGFLADEVEKWQAQVKFLRNKMHDVHKRKRTREAATSFLAGL
ncbi:hypothetical protein A3840_16490 [Devosia elaeis]|uniref:NACHT domain-containing protein n=1 Tax=Devosia elaeis TaxID=1770058 RepID=A0A178HNY6_9HYPH|nr:hypothetical protein A3840_16490 [Devosia elaeis]